MCVSISLADSSSQKKEVVRKEKKMEMQSSVEGC